MRQIRFSLAIILTFVLFTAVSGQSTEFSYQGSLRDGAMQASGNYDFEFVLFDAQAGGTQLGTTNARSGVAVANGIFAVRLDFGNQFPGAKRFLEIRVKLSGGGALTTLIPRQELTSIPYAVKSLDAENANTATTALTAVNATTATNFIGPLAGDVTGTQGSTTVAGLRGRNVAPAQPNNGQVLKFNTTTSQWEPANDETATAGGGGTITGVTAGTGLTGGGATGSVTLNIAPGGVGATEIANNAVTTSKIADANVTNAKIADVAGSKVMGSISTATIPGANVTGTVANATNAMNATTASNATSAQNAVNAATAVNLSGPLAGDVTGTQGSTNVARLQGRNVANTAPTNGQVLKYNSTTNQWTPDTDQTGGGGGTITGVAVGAGLGGGGTSGNITIGILPGGVSETELANGAVTTTKIADASITNAKIVTVDGAKVGGTLPVSTIPAGSSNYIQNGTTVQPTSGFNVSGSGRVGGTMLAGTFDGSGASITNLNASNIAAGTLDNARLGQIPTANIANGAVTANKIAGGEVVKSINTLKDSVTLAAGSNITITPSGNTLTIASTGGGGNPILNQTTQQANANFNISGNGTAGDTLSANIVNATTQYNIDGNRVLSNPGTNNLFVGSSAGSANTTGAANAFFGSGAGSDNTTASFNSFFGSFAGRTNTTGDANAFFGQGAGSANTTASFNAFFGYIAGRANTTGNSNAFFGSSAGWANTTGFKNAFFGNSAGFANTTGDNNAFFGSSAGFVNTTGGSNVFIGWSSGESNTTGSNNTAIGNHSNVGSGNLNYATAIGAGAVATSGNRIQLGRDGIDTVTIGTLAAVTANALCINPNNVLALCSSSIRYKTNIQPLERSLSLIQRLRPVTFDWIDRDETDLGLVAEEVAAIDPLLVTYNRQGEIQGVKYSQLSVVLINAVKEQQAQIERQQSQIEMQQIKIDALLKIVCASEKTTEICKEMK